MHNVLNDLQSFIFLCSILVRTTAFIINNFLKQNCEHDICMICIILKFCLKNAKKFTKVHRNPNIKDAAPKIIEG